MTAALSQSAAARSEGAALRRPPFLLIALGLAMLMTFSWAMRDWAALRLMRLPDNDDMMRLAEVRDWIAGQGFNDLMQYRLGLDGGASMHWSRIADAIPAAIVLLLTPLVGQPGAETAMILLYPGLMLMAYLLLSARIGGRLGGDGAKLFAMLLAALAFPTISLFLPGRIDHHALQIVFTLILVDAMVAAPTLRRGAIAGLVTALSMAVGLEAAPEIIAAMAGLGILWLIGGRAESRRALGFGAALGGVTLALYVFARPHVFPEQWCDGFTPSSTRATFVLAGAWLVLGVAGTRVSDWRARIAIAGAAGAAAGLSALRLSPVCFNGPYDALTPFLKQVWMSNVSEAKDLFWGQDTIGTSVAYGGVVFGGLALALHRLWSRRHGPIERGWIAFSIFLAISTVAAVLQVRVTYILAGLAAIPFAVALAEARDAGLLRRLGLWVLGAGVTWNLIGAQMDSVFAQPIEVARVIQRDCVKGEPILVAGAQPTGRIMAPIDLGSYLIGMTRHHVFAAGYHRNNDGNMASYRFFLAEPGKAHAMARTLGLNYVALCPDSLRETALQPYRPGSLAAQLQSNGAPPVWLEPIPTGGSMLLYRVR